MTLEAKTKTEWLRWMGVALSLKRAHHKNVLAYLKATQQPLGLTVTAAPHSEQIIDGFRIVNLPVYMTNRQVIDEIAS